MKLVSWVERGVEWGIRGSEWGVVEREDRVRSRGRMEQGTCKFDVNKRVFKLMVNKRYFMFERGFRSIERKQEGDDK